MSDAGTSISLWMVLQRVISLMSLRESARLCQPGSAIISDTHTTGIGVVIGDELSCSTLDHLNG